MPHTHTESGQHDLVASAFILRLDTPEPTIMLHMHRKYAHYLQFGGHVELDETPWQAVIRELREESGYGAEQLAVFQPSGRFTEQFVGAAVHPLPFYFNTHRIQQQEHFHSDLSYAMVADGPPQHAIGAGESADIKCYTAQEIADLPDEQMYQITRASALYILGRLRHEWQAVPSSEWPVL